MKRARGSGKRNDASRRRRSALRGFSLLETIAAILLLAISVAALMRVASASLSLTDKLGQTARADMLAQGKLDALGIAEPLVPGARRSVRPRLSLAPSHRRMHWSECQPTVPVLRGGQL